MEKDEISAGIIAVIVVAPLAVLLPMYWGWAAWLLWGWFVVPVFGAVNIAYWQACGLMLFYGIFKTGMTKTPEGKSETAAYLLAPLFAVGVGLIFKALA